MGYPSVKPGRIEPLHYFWHQKDFLPDHIETSKYQNIPIYAFQNSSDKTIFVKIYAHESCFTLTVIVEHTVDYILFGLGVLRNIPKFSQVRKREGQDSGK